MDFTHRLPAEILLKIFSHCTVDIGFDPEYPSESYHDILAQAPHSLTCVSSRWRSITLTYPQVWTSLSLPSLPSTPEAIELLFTELQTWLKRSGVLALSFRVHISAYFLGSTKQSALALSRPYIERYMHILAEHSRRWLDVCLDLSYTRVLPDIHPFTDLSSTPLLRSFALSAPMKQPRRRENDHHHIVSHFHLKNAPRLHQVNIYHLLTTKWVLPWTHLRTLRMHTQAWNDDFDAKALMRNLKECAHLEELIVRFVFTEGPPRSSHGRRPVVLPSLRRLEADLGGAKDTMFHYFLDTLVTPNLERLILACGNYLNFYEYSLYGMNGPPAYQPGEVHAAVLKFVGHCEETLKELQVVDEVHPDVLVMALQKLKNLEVLNMPSDALAFRISERFMPPPSNESTSSLALQPNLGSAPGATVLLPALARLLLQGRSVATDWHASDRPRESSFVDFLARMVEWRAVSRSSLGLQAFKFGLWESMRAKMEEVNAEAYDKLEVLQHERKLCIESIEA